LEADCDGVGFGRADPDWQVTIRILLLEDDDTLVIHQRHADAFDRHL